jgi:hypothetical protein
MRLLAWTIALIFVVDHAIAVESQNLMSSSTTAARPAQNNQQSKQATTQVKETTHKKESEKEDKAQKEKKQKEDKKKKDKEKKEKEKKEKEKKDNEKKKKDDDEPWFIGTILAQYGDNTDPGKIELSPTFMISRAYGAYAGNGALVHDRNVHVNSLILAIESGITKNVDVVVDTAAIWAEAGDQVDVFHLTDTQIYLGLQFLRDKKGTCIPDIRILIGENFPTGKFDLLDERMRFADVTGTGSYATLVVFVWQKIFYTHTQHPYKWNFNFLMSFPSRVHTRGLSVHGGGPDVQGIANPGHRFNVNLSYEYKFGKHWGWGMDLNYDHFNRSTFVAKSGIPLFSGFPASDLISMAPELEYNFCENFAVMAGFWYSLWGRNSVAFFNGFFSLSYEF